ncbi:MAG TPA: rhodanese-like domain-containing protein [Methanotrichaceae archaeon]|nr:rhodanese-like domain-containing protein [Methanotrichaceae archaeon]
MTKIDAIHIRKAGSPWGRGRSNPRWSCILGVLMLSLTAFAPLADAGCSCSAVGNWEAKAQAFLDSDDNGMQPVSPSSSQNSTNAAANPAANTLKPEDRSDSFPNDDILKPIKSVSSSDVVVDVSNGDDYAKAHVKSAIHLPTRSFLDENGNLKENEELAQVLGNAGISRDDSVVLYGSSESSGEAEFAFWVLSYLGQKDIMLLDGNLADWKAAGLPVESSQNKKDVVMYKPDINSEILAEYEYVKSSQAQIADARPFTEFGKGRIPGSTALDPANVIKGDKIKDASGLDMVFARLDKDKPIVVYSDDYSRSSLVWFALQLMGYEAATYTWEDWKDHEFKDVKEEAASTQKYVKLGKTGA